MEYIRKFYDVPAKRGMKVRFKYHKPPFETGTITGSKDAHLRVHFPSAGYSKYYHPTYMLEYIDEVGKVIWPVQQEPGGKS